MKTIVAATAAFGMALSLAACGGATTANEAVANDTFANDTVFNDELPADGNTLAVDNALDASAIGNGADNTLTATDNTL